MIKNFFGRSKGFPKGFSLWQAVATITSDFKKIYISLLLAPTSELLNWAISSIYRAFSGMGRGFL
jgi:hypothetical protein